MARNNQRGSKNNNPEGRNQYSGGWMDSAKERPMRTAAAAAAAVGAGVFLWSRRNQISEQISNLSDQVTDWAGNMQRTDADSEFEIADAGGTPSSASTRRSSSSSSGSGSGRSSRGQSGGAMRAAGAGANGTTTGGASTL